MTFRVFEEIVTFERSPLLFASVISGTIRVGHLEEESRR